MKPRKNQETVVVPAHKLRALLKQIETFGKDLDRLERRIAKAQPVGNR